MKIKPPPDGLQLTLDFNPVTVLVEIDAEPNHTIDPVWWKKIEVFRDDMIRAAMYITKRREDAEDVVGDAFLVAHAKRKQYRFDQNLRGWLCTITRRLAINHYHKEKKTGHDLVESYKTFDSRDSGSDLVQSFSCIKDLEKTMGLLDVVTKSVMLLSMDGMKPQEIQEEMGLTLHKIRYHIKRGRFLLSKHMGLKVQRKKKND